MSRWRGPLTQFVVLFASWMALSDEWRPLFIAFGVLSAAGVTLLTHRVVATVTRPGDPRPAGGWHQVWWTAVFFGWMVGRIFMASGQVAYFALHPGLPFRPRFVRFRTDLQRPLSRATLACALTLVPGTTAVRIDGDELLVHTLIPDAADDLASGQMQTMIGRALGEGPQGPPEMHWGPLIEDAVR